MMKKFDALDPSELVGGVHSMPMERKVEIFARLSPQARETFLQEVDRPEEILRHVSEEELFATVRYLGEENATALLTYSTPRQLLYFIDLDFWKKDMLDFMSAARWLRIISQLGHEKIVQFVRVVDPELLVSVFRFFIRVQARNPDLDFFDESEFLPPFTLDDTFFIEFLVSDSEEAVRSFLETIFYLDSAYYFTLMHSLASGLLSENEEMALKWHRARLADKGFPVFEEALEIYRYLQRAEISFPETPETGFFAEPQEQERLLLAYPLQVISKDSLLRRSLEKIADPDQKDRIVTELAHVANKIMVADGKDPGNINDLHASLDKVSGYINISLEDFCDDDEDAASKLLRANHMEILFRRGFSLILDFRKHAQTFVRHYEGGAENLGYPLAGLMKGLFQKRPIFAGDFLGEKTPRDFRCVADLATIKNLLDKDLVEQGWEPI